MELISPYPTWGKPENHRLISAIDSIVCVHKLAYVQIYDISIQWVCMIDIYIYIEVYVV